MSLDGKILLPHFQSTFKISNTGSAVTVKLQFFFLSFLVLNQVTIKKVRIKIDL